MPKTNYFSMLEAVVEKIKTADFLEEIRLDPDRDINDHVVFTDKFRKTDLPEDRYPIIEVEQDVFGPTRYADQVNCDGIINIIVRCTMLQLKNDDNFPLTKENYKEIIEAGEETLGLMYSFNEDTQLGFPPVQGFVQTAGSTPVYADPQLDGSTMMFAFVVSFDLINLIEGSAQ